MVSGGCYATVLDKNMNAKIDPCLNWNTDMKDKVNTIGAGFTWKGLASGKLELVGNALYSDARSDNGMTGGTYVNNPYAVAGQACRRMPAVFYIPAQNLPTVTQKMIAAADRGAVRDRQALGDPRVLLVAEAATSPTTRTTGMQYGTHYQRDTDQPDGAELQRLGGRDLLYLPLAVTPPGDWMISTGGGGLRPRFSHRSVRDSFTPHLQVATPDPARSGTPSTSTPADRADAGRLPAASALVAASRACPRRKSS